MSKFNLIFKNTRKKTFLSYSFTGNSICKLSNFALLFIDLQNDVLSWKKFWKKQRTSNFIFIFKVQLFWEGHKNVRNRPHGFDVYKVNFKTIRTISHIFVAFSEKLNFNRWLPTRISTGILEKFHCRMLHWEILTEKLGKMK